MIIIIILVITSILEGEAMDTAVNDINRKEMQEREEHRFAADFLRRRASSLPPLSAA